MSNCAIFRRVVAAFVVTALMEAAPIYAAPNRLKEEKAARNSNNNLDVPKSSVFYESRRLRRDGHLAQNEGESNFAADFCDGKSDQTDCTDAGTCRSGKCSGGKCFSVNAANGQTCDGGQCRSGECKPAISCTGVVDLTPCEPGPIDDNLCISDLGAICLSGSCQSAPVPCPTDPATVATSTTPPATPANRLSCAGVPALSKCEVNACVWGVCSNDVCTPTAMLPDGTTCPGGFCFALGRDLGSAGCQPESQRLILFPEATTTATTIPATTTTETSTAAPVTEKQKPTVNENESKWAGPLLAVVVILVLIVIAIAYIAMYKPDLIAKYNITCLDWLISGGQVSGSGPMLVKPFAPLPPRAPRVPPKPPTDLALADSFVSAKLPFNVNKNRYRDVLPYDATRVKLKADEGVEGSDFINANFVCGVERDAPYIATQGPIESTVGDFWRMVWEQQVSTIAMLTRFVESKKEKVFRYFPAGVNVEVQYGNYLVTMMAEVSEPEFVVRRLDVVEAATGIKRVIRHAQYTAWPDHGVPEETRSILTYRRVVRQCHEDAHGVLLVHCSAGVGRAGSFIAVDQALEAFNATGKVDIYATVCTMRRCRPYVVQRASQYVYLHRAILDAVTTEPPIAAEGLDFTQVDFATRFFVPSQLPAFDLGCGGRNILHVGSISRCDGNWANAKDAMLCLTTDVLLVCDVTPNGFYRLAIMPVLRNKVSVEGSDPNSETASFTIEIEGEKPGKTSKLNCVAEDGAAKREWETKLSNRSGFLPTESLRGPRIVGFQTPTWHEALVLFGCADPNTEGGSQELQREWDVIPKILDADAALIPDQNVFPGLTDATNVVSTFGGSGAQNTNPLFGAQIEGVGGSGAGWMDHEIQPVDPSSPASPAINMSQFPGFPGSPAGSEAAAAAATPAAVPNVGGLGMALQFAQGTPAGAGMLSPTPGFGGMTPGGMTPGGMTPGGMTPGGMFPGGMTPGGMTPGGMFPGGMFPAGMPLTRAMFDRSGKPMTPGALQAHRYQQQQMEAAMSGMFPGFGTGAPKEFQPVMPLFTPRAPNMAKAANAYNPPFSPTDSVGNPNLPDRINSLSASTSSLVPATPLFSSDPKRAASGISIDGVEDSSTDTYMSLLGSQNSATSTDPANLSPSKSMMGGPRRFSTTDLSGTFNPMGHNMPKLPSLRGRGGTMRGLAAITEADTRRMSIMSELAEPLELAGPLDVSVHEALPQSPGGPNFAPPAPPALDQPVGLGAVAAQIAEGALTRSDIMTMAPKLTAPPKAYDPRSAMMAQMVSPAIFNSPVNAKSDMPNGIERWAAPELYDFDDGTQIRTRPGTPEDYSVEEGVLDVSFAKGVPDIKPKTILNDKEGGSLQDRWKKAARRASIAAQIAAMINTPIKHDAPFGLVGKAAKRMGAPDGAGDDRRRSLQEGDKKLNEMPTLAAFRSKHTWTMHDEARKSLSEEGGSAAAPANEFAAAAVSRSAPRRAPAPATPEPAHDPNECTYLGSCQCPDCR